MSGFAIADFGPAVALALSGATNELDVAAGTRDVGLAPAIVTSVWILAGGAGVLLRTVTLLDAHRHGWRMGGGKQRCV